MNSNLERIVSVRHAVNRVHVPGPIHLPRLAQIETKHWLADAALPPRGKFAAVAAGSAAAAGAYALFRFWASHRSLTILESGPHELCLLHDLQGDEEALQIIQEALLTEWGPYGPEDMAAMRKMAKNAGQRVFVLQVQEDERWLPVAVLQTGLIDAHGDPAAVIEKYPSFAAITADGTWRRADKMKGDTAILLQITAFGERSHGVGSMLRNAALNSLPASVKYALTTTPVAEAFDLDASPDSFPPAVRFHYRGGARPAGFQSDYKVPATSDPDHVGRQQNPHVVFMRYQRLPDGQWEGVPASSFQPRGKSKPAAEPIPVPA